MVHRDEPRSARKLLRMTNLSYPARKVPSVSLPSTPNRRIVSIHSTDSEDESDTDVESQASAPVRNARPASQPKKAGSRKVPRLTKKALEAAEQQRREQYAQAFFSEMNRTVFDGGLPGDTNLVWNKRLVSTAGRAKWSRLLSLSAEVQRVGADGMWLWLVSQEPRGCADDHDRVGHEDPHIRRLDKITFVDDVQLKHPLCAERIRNTLSHEMCHLACWVISDAPTENHGNIFKGW